MKRDATLLSGERRGLPAAARIVGRLFEDDTAITFAGLFGESIGVCG
jgi:hypothetical protein